MDEASTGLDPGARHELWQYILELRKNEGVTVLLTSHILDEADRCDRLALLHEGRLVSQGSPPPLKAKVSGDGVILEAPDLSALAGKIEQRFSVTPVIADGALRVEMPNGHRFITEVLEAFPGSIDSVGLHKPTLEDVFMRETGATLW